MTIPSNDPYYRGPFKPDDSIAGQFGNNVAFVLVIDKGEDSVLRLYGNPDQPEPTIPTFPKTGVNLMLPDHIMVFDTWSSPGCKTVIINGRPYDKCD